MHHFSTLLESTGTLQNSEGSVLTWLRKKSVIIPEVPPPPSGGSMSKSFFRWLTFVPVGPTSRWGWINHVEVLVNAGPFWAPDLIPVIPLPSLLPPPAPSLLPTTTSSHKLFPADWDESSLALANCACVHGGREAIRRLKRIPKEQRNKVPSFLNMAGVY